MCKVTGTLINGPGEKEDCGKCSCPTSSASHSKGNDGKCTKCGATI